MRLLTVGSSLDVGSEFRAHQQGGEGIQFRSRTRRRPGIEDEDNVSRRFDRRAAARDPSMWPGSHIAGIDLQEPNFHLPGILDTMPDGSRYGGKPPCCT